MFLILVFVALVSIIVFFRKKYTYWTERGVVQDSAFPLLGVNWKLLTYQASEVQIFQDLYYKHYTDRYIGIYDFLTPLIVIKDPELLQQILIKKFEHFMDHKQTIPSNVDPLWNKNLFSLKGNKWKDTRSSLSPSFTANKMRYMFALMEQCANNFVKYLKVSNENVVEIDIREGFSRYTNDVITSTCLGNENDSINDTSNEFYLNGLEVSYDVSFWKHVKLVLLRGFPWMSSIIKTNKFGDDFTNFFCRVIKENVEYREKHNVKRPDMITMLMEARNEPEKKEEKDCEDFSFNINEFNSNTTKKRKIDLSLEDITANAMIFFFAGFTTTTSLLSFMSYELAVNPDIQEKLLKEVDALRVKGKKIEYGDLSELSFMHMIISETLRKYPPFCRNDRRCTKPFTIAKERDSENSFTIDAGCDVWIPVYAIHHDSQYWPEPEKFDPERFSPSNKKNIKAGTYMPFSIGPRGCIGYRFVLQTVKILFYELLCDFEIIPVERTTYPCELTKNTSHVIPGSVWLGFKKREHSN